MLPDPAKVDGGAGHLEHAVAALLSAFVSIELSPGTEAVATAPAEAGGVTTAEAAQTASVSFEEKFSYRRPMYACLRYWYQKPLYDKQFQASNSPYIETQYLFVVATAAVHSPDRHFVEPHDSSAEEACGGVFYSGHVTHITRRFILRQLIFMGFVCSGHLISGMILSKNLHHCMYCHGSHHWLFAILFALKYRATSCASIFKLAPLGARLLLLRSTRLRLLNTRIHFPKEQCDLLGSCPPILECESPRSFQSRFCSSNGVRAKHCMDRSLN